jgi:hypothetical protein
MPPAGFSSRRQQVSRHGILRAACPGDPVLPVRRQVSGYGFYFNEKKRLVHYVLGNEDARQPVELRHYSSDGRTSRRNCFSRDNYPGTKRNYRNPGNSGGLYFLTSCPGKSGADYFTARIRHGNTVILTTRMDEKNSSRILIIYRISFCERRVRFPPGD